MKSRIILEDGFVLEGTHYGAASDRTGEVVFNTSMTGYQEIITDPSYAGQIVIMTYPHIGNYGVNTSDAEAQQPYAEGLVVRDFTERPSNWRAEESLNDYLEKHKIPVISGVDTRALVRRIRSAGAMRGMIALSDKDNESLIKTIKKSRSMIGSDLVKDVSRNTIDYYPALPRSDDKPFCHIVAYDFGIKQSILRSLTASGLSVTVVPCRTSGEDVLKLHPDGVFLSNGPGDPAAVYYGVQNTRKLIGKVPIFGICLGHQILALAIGGKTFKLKFGHRGGNQPVKNLDTEKVEITVHNHGFAVDQDSLKDTDVVITHVNLNDNTLEGFRLRNHPAFCVQYHPEAAPGPNDASYLFEDFYRLIQESK